nr:hypothetical protein [Microbacterium mangrovi]
MTASASQQRVHDLDELRPSLVADRVVEVRLATEVAGLLVGCAGHEVPARPPVREMVEGCQLAGNMVRLVVRRGDRRHQPDALGGLRQRAEQGERLEPGVDGGFDAGIEAVPHVQFVGEEDRRETGALGGAGEVAVVLEVEEPLGLGIRQAPAADVLTARIEQAECEDQVPVRAHARTPVARAHRQPRAGATSVANCSIASLRWFQLP